MRPSFLLAGLFAPLLLHPSVSKAGDYWVYAYNDFEVMAENPGMAVDIANRIQRFDIAVTRVLQLSDKHVATRIYVLSPDQIGALLPPGNHASYAFTGYDAIVLSETDRHDPYWAPLFGYTGSLLINGRSLRLPHWYQVGVPEVFASTQFDGDLIKTGGVDRGFVATLNSGGLLPVRTVLRTERNDPQLQNTQFAKSFEAESWYLAYLILTQGKLQSEFNQYLAGMRDGKAEADAFADSFKFGYEDLDKMLARWSTEPSKIFTVDVPRGPKGQAEPRHLSSAEVQARLAELSLQWNRRVDAQSLATQALKQDPNNQLALSIVAESYLRDGNFGAALMAVDKIDALHTSDPSVETVSAGVLAGLSCAVAAGRPSIAADSESLAQRAKADYEAAIAASPEYLRAWSGLAYFYGCRRDKAGAQELVVRARPVTTKYADNAALASAFAQMCSRTAQLPDAKVFANYWRDDSVDQTERARAADFIAKLQSH